MLRDTSGAEPAAISHLDLRHLAADLGVTEAALRDAVCQATDHSVLMDRMMRARGLDPETTRITFGNLMREMAETCTRCHDSTLCRVELDAGTANKHCHDFCGAAQVMDVMKCRVTHPQLVEAPHDAHVFRPRLKMRT